MSIIREPFVSDGTKGFQFQRTTVHNNANDEDKKRDSLGDDDEDDLFGTNVEEELCGEDGSGDFNHHAEDSLVSSGATGALPSDGAVKPGGDAGASAVLQGANDAAALLPPGAVEESAGKIDSCGDII